MKKITRVALIASTMTFAFNSAFANENVVNVYNWSDYIDEKVLSDSKLFTTPSILTRY
jgi:spermidine/putrescine-binding protein